MVSIIRGGVYKYASHFLRMLEKSMSTLKILSYQNQLKLYFPICLVDGVLDIPSIIYDSIKAITRASAVFFWVNHHQHITMELFCWQNGCLFTILYRNNQHKMIMCPYVWNKQCKYGHGLAMFGSLVTCTVYSNKVTIGELKLRLGL